MQKRRILAFIDWYIPGFRGGGPTRACANLVDRLQDEMHFDVVTRNVDYKSTIPYENIEFDRWTAMENGSRTYYISNKNLRWSKIKECMNDGQYDIIYLQSMFSYYFTIVPLVLKRMGVLRSASIVLEPHGMLASGAMSVKPTKKKIFLFFYKLFRFQYQIIYHASSKNEIADIKRIFGEKVEIKYAPSLPDAIIHYPLQHQSKNVGTLNLFFLARISPEKNLQFAVKLLINMNGNIALNICGPLSDRKYWNEIQQIIDQLPSNIQVKYLGELDRHELQTFIPTQHFLFLPTLGESFGHAIIESLGFGVPVIISDQTPWKDLEQHNAGWIISLADQNRFTSVLQKCVKMNSNEYQLLSKSARAYAINFSTSEGLVEASRSLFVNS